MGSQMKKALVVTHVSGFVPQFEMNNVRLLQEIGYEVHYASNFQNVSYGIDNRRLEDTGIICHQVDFTRSPYDIKQHKIAIKQMQMLLEKESFTIMHCHTPVGAALARIVAKPYRKQGLKVIYTAHGFHFYKGAPWKYWLMFYPVEFALSKVTDVLITINKEDFERAKRFCKFSKTKVEQIHGVGLDLAYWSGKDLNLGEREQMRMQVRKQLGIQEKEIAILSVGELIPRKNHEEVIRKLAEKKKKGEKNFRYFICGQGVLKEFLQDLIMQSNLAKEVTLLGYRTDIRRLLYGMDLFVFPSKQEGMPVALMEAVAAGLPIKASDIRGNREVIADSKDGKGLPDKYDIKQISKTMRRIYEDLQ